MITNYCIRRDIDHTLNAHIIANRYVPIDNGRGPDSSPVPYQSLFTDKYIMSALEIIADF